LKILVSENFSFSIIESTSTVVGSTVL